MLFINDFINLLRDCLIPLHDSSKKDIYENIPEIF